MKNNAIYYNTDCKCSAYSNFFILAIKCTKTEAYKQQSISFKQTLANEKLVF